MSDPTTSCTDCGRPVADNAYICQRCTERLEYAISEAPAYAAELETTRLRQSRTGSAGVGVLSRSYEKPLPWDEHAAETANHLRAILVSWARLISEDRGVDLPSAPHLATWLLGHVEWLRHQSFADDVLDEITTAVASARHAVDLRPELAYAGPCRAEVEVEDGVHACCTADLYVPTGQAAVRCKECSAEHDVASRQRWLLDAVQDQLAHAGMLSSAVSRLGQSVTSSMIRNYAARGRIVAHGLDLKGRPLYRVGDLLDLLAGQAARHSASA